ncbi:uncharacterized protein isoform X5 [Macaca fascicularis]|uniref:uncharacterized protein isoform X5 n=1 Tax=Macaca fascicularis TaxID=9541 RepID=UPI003D159D85
MQPPTFTDLRGFWTGCSSFSGFAERWEQQTRRPADRQETGYSAGSVEGPHTDLEEAGPRIRSPGTGADGTQPRGQRAGTRTGAHICAQADHVNAAAQEFHRPTPHAPPPSQPLPATHHLSPAGF